MDLRYAHLATTKILCHVIVTGRSTYSIPSLARHISQRMTGESTGAHSLLFSERALEMGYLGLCSKLTILTSEVSEGR